jgi:exonuclease III
MLRFHISGFVKPYLKCLEPMENTHENMGKLREIVDTMIRRRANILCVQEMKWKGQKAKEVKDTGFKLWYTENMSTNNGVGIVLDKSLKD